MPPVDRSDIKASLVARLVAEQFPEWADLPVTPVEHDGWDNVSFRLGSEFVARLPSADAYAAKVDKEHRWLPHLAAALPVRIPEPLAKGAPGCGFPRPWSVRRWLNGERADLARIDDLARFATEVTDFLAGLHRVDTTGGPAPGAHNFHRGGSLAVYDAEAREAIAALGGEIDVRAASRIWDAALRATWNGIPVWVHGDVSSSNLLVLDGRLAAVLDFGGCGVGDPACDLVIAWTFFEGTSRAAFRAGIALDDATWTRARGWALWKAAITLAPSRESHAVAPDTAALRQGWRGGARRVLVDVLADRCAAP
jgi:aminoglycoside phosphotransferase (APT) family kinase protein